MVPFCSPTVVYAVGVVAVGIVVVVGVVAVAVEELLSIHAVASERLFPPVFVSIFVYIHPVAPLFVYLRSHFDLDIPVCVVVVARDVVVVTYAYICYLHKILCFVGRCRHGQWEDIEFVVRMSQ
jgi:hypothetical protein